MHDYVTKLKKAERARELREQVGVSAVPRLCSYHIPRLCRKVAVAGTEAAVAVRVKAEIQVPVAVSQKKNEDPLCSPYSKYIQREGEVQQAEVVALALCKVTTICWTRLLIQLRDEE